MSIGRLILLSGALASAAASAQDDAAPAADRTEALLHSAQVWEVHDRADLARAALEKAALSRTDNPEVLLRLGEVDLESGDLPAAERTLRQLQTSHPDAAATHALDDTYRVATRDRLRLASVKRLTQVGRDAEALAALKELFPNGAPDGGVGITYYQIVARTAGGWEAARAGLEQLAAHHPYDPRFKLALAKLLTDRAVTRLQGLRMLTALAGRDDLRTSEVDAALADAIHSTGSARVPRPILDAYAGRNAADQEVHRALAQDDLAVEQNRLLAENTLSGIMPGLQQRLLEDTWQQLQERLRQNPYDAAAAQAQLLLHIQQGAAGPDASTLETLSPDTGGKHSRNAAAVSEYWRQQALAASDQGQLRLAEAELRAALAIRKGDFAALADIADALAGTGQPAIAGELLETVWICAPNEPHLLRSRVHWLADNGRADAALALLDADGGANDKSLRADVLARRAADEDLAGAAASALHDLVNATTLAPLDPWIRLDLARQYAKLGAPERGREVMADGVRLQPGDHDTRYAQAIYLASLDARGEALATLEAIPTAERSAGMQHLDASLHIGASREAALQLHAQGDTAGAERTMATAEPYAASDPALLGELASAWIALGDPQRGLAPLQDRVQQETAQPELKELLFAWAGALDDADETERLQPVLDRLGAQPALSPAEVRQLARLQSSADRRAIRELQNQGRYAEAQERLRQALARSPGDTRLLELQADLEGSMGHWPAARDRYAALLQATPDDLDLRLSYARALAESGDRAAARAQLQYVRERAAPGDLDTRVGLARRDLALGDLAQARTEVQALLAAAPNDGRVLMQAGNLGRGEHDYAAAAGYFKRAAAAGDEDTARSAREDLAAIEQRRQAWVTGGVENLTKPGDPGTSEFNLTQGPLEMWLPYRYDGHFFVHADTVAINSGTLPTDFNDAAQFGQVYALATPGPNNTVNYANSTPGVRQDQLGVALAGGYRNDSFEADLGTTPIGFKVTDVVGGARWTPTLGPLDLSVGVARRPVTGSLLSYAGALDPASGRVWGGVRSLGPDLRAAYYGPRLSFSASMQYLDLRGDNVAGNTELATRFTGDWKFIDQPQFRAYAGGTLTFWHYDKNLQYYTFGQGGYYSPQSYVNVALPLEVQGRGRRWSYLLRTSASYSVSHEDDTPYYPADPALQARAVALSLPSGFSTEPVYSGGTSHGIGYTFRADAEYEVAYQWLLGGRVNIDRSDYYRPTTFMLYFRHLFAPWESQPYLPPRPPTPYADY